MCSFLQVFFVERIYKFCFHDLLWLIHKIEKEYIGLRYTFLYMKNIISFRKIQRRIVSSELVTSNDQSIASFLQYKIQLLHICIKICIHICTYIYIHVPSNEVFSVQYVRIY